MITLLGCGFPIIHSSSVALAAVEAYLTTATAELQLTDAYDVYPRSNATLIVNGSPTAPGYDTDFNLTPRNLTKPTIGAYEYTTATNPGWQVQKGITCFPPPLPLSSRRSLIN